MDYVKCLHVVENLYVENKYLMVLACPVYGLRLSYDPKVDRVNKCVDIRSCAEGTLHGQLCTCIP